jgi:hypothetical protein
LSACGRSPDTYAPPIQRQPLLGADAHIGASIAMDDPMADAYIVRDISKTTEGSWRWTYQHPELRFYLKQTSGAKLAVDFGVPEATFKDTGPVTITFRVNGHVLDKVLCDKPGNRHFEKAVPSAFLRAREDNFVAMEADKKWVSKDDGAVLSFLLTRAGFVQ